ncbi:signal peptidase I [Leptotrichia buccalis]|uniref:Signal peptidase I n=1 Tax=Leptotrichia buccalis (strain ATCC 14201 / DSM 1135 / JCM 12969 / NCTC 10249 / C-1013-b) TaxID=523794 RepID=C7NB54_LEPBD|nr:signal peptidase I [Leptotrichia buccalis]ACV39385.1 signal peptidase I [Leptotrichia buccalis C-1013-b]
MNMILWTIFYLIVSLILMYFFFKEKYVINLLRVKEDEILKKVSLEKNEKNIMVGNMLTIVALVVTAIFFILIDRTPDSIIRIKLWGIYGVFILNVVFYVLRAEHEWIFLGNLVMMFLGRLMFNILDMNFYIYLGINVVISLILIYLFKSLPKEEITEQTILKEVTKDNKKLEKILTESKIKNESTEEIFKKIFPNENISVKERIAKEERKRSTFGKAISRIDNTMLAIILVMVIQVFYIGNYVIPSGSMEPTIAIKDRVFANMVKYRFTHPKVGQIIAFKEPMTDKVMYTKRLVGEPGTTLQIAKGKMDINKFEIANVDNKPVYPSFSGDKRKFEEDFKKYTEQVNEFNANKLQNVGGAIMTNDKKSEILEKVTPQKVYLPEGLLMNNKIYIPKKGDKVKLDKIIAINKVFGKTDDGTLVGQVDWESYYDGKGYKNITGKEFLELIKTDKNFKDIIGNDDELNANPANVLTNAYYTFTLKVEGRDEMVMPIMDFKYNDDLFKKLLNGETITLDKNYYMAMGDNTANSKDTRYFGLVSEPRIKGELLIRWWPLSRIGLL